MGLELWFTFHFIIITCFTTIYTNWFCLEIYQFADLSKQSLHTNSLVVVKSWMQILDPGRRMLDFASLDCTVWIQPRLQNHARLIVGLALDGRSQSPPSGFNLGCRTMPD
jgi:hypothetical protein